MASAVEYEPKLVQIEHENYIPVPRHVLIEKLALRVDENEREDFLQFCRLLEAIYHFELHATAQELHKRYVLFDPVNSGDPEPYVDYEAEEDEFLRHFWRLMEKGNFKPLTQEDIDLAEEEDYLFTLPVRIDWSAHDEDMLSRFWKKHPELLPEGEKPEYVDKILIFRRGTGVDRTKGLFLLEKFDILLNKLFAGIFRLIGRLFGRKKKSEPETTTTTATTAGEKTSIHADRFVERKSLKNAPWKFLRATVLQEPTFEQLVVVFRFATSKNILKYAPDQRDRGMHIKMFRDIPMADLEVVFPAKKLSMKPKDLVTLVLTAIVGILISIFKLAFAATVSPVVALIVLIGLISYALKVFFGYRTSKARYQSLVTSTLYEKSLNNDAGVIHTLVDSMEDQEFKEAALAYFFLWQDGPQTTEELDACCEQFLKDDFGLEIDFEVPDAVQKLRNENLVSDSAGSLSAPPLGEALRILDHKWDNYFQYN